MSRHLPKFFITGAAGFVGRAICLQLRSAGHEVAGLVRRPDAELAELRVKQVVGDVTLPGDWIRAASGSQVIIHCAANAAFGSSRGEAQHNVEGGLKILEAAKAAGTGLQRVVLVSSIGAVDRPPGDDCRVPLSADSPLHPASFYGRSKAECERLFRVSGLPFSIVRPGMVVGGEMRADSHFSAFVQMALRNALPAKFAWPGRFSVVHVTDLAAGVIAVSTHPEAAGRTFFCSGEPVAVNEVFEMASPDAFRLPMGWLEPMAGMLPFKLKALLRPALTADDAPLRALGWELRVPARSALLEVVARERARHAPLADVPGQCVITGAASGLGRAMAERLAPLRRRILLVDRDAAGIAELQAVHSHARTYVLDLASEKEIQEFLRSPSWTEFPVSELIACAGLGLRGTVDASTTADHARLFRVNLEARLALAQAALPAMKRQHFGRIVFISSSSAFQPLPGMASYAASNAALLLLGEAWGAEISGSGVEILTICPGGMQTNFQATAGVRRLDSEKLMQPGEVADRIMRELPRASRTVVVSARAHGMALAARLLPRAWSVALWKRLMSGLR